MKLTLLKAAFLFIGGLLLCGAGVWFAVAHAELAKNGERAPGLVVDISVQKVRGQKLHHPVVRYQPAGQEPIRFKERTGLWSSLFEIGDTVAVLYYPNAPTEIKSGTPNNFSIVLHQCRFSAAMRQPVEF